MPNLWAETSIQRLKLSIVQLPRALLSRNESLNMRDRASSRGPRKINKLEQIKEAAD